MGLRQQPFAKCAQQGILGFLFGAREVVGSDTLQRQAREHPQLARPELIGDQEFRNQGDAKARACGADQRGLNIETGPADHIGAAQLRSIEPATPRVGTRDQVQKTQFFKAER